MKRRPVLGLLLSDFSGFIAIVAVAVFLGVTTNALRPKPLLLFSYRPAYPATDAPLPEVTLDEIRVRSGRKDATIIDARPAEFYSLGHVPGATSVPLAQLEAGLPPDRIDRDASIIVYCEDVSCPAAKSAARLLRKLGYRNVSVYPGGWYAWKKAGLPIEANP